MVMDIGTGILLALWTIDHFGVPFGLGVIVFGIFAALFPDLDTLTAFLPEGNFLHKIVGDHRGLFHRPFFYFFLCPVVFLLGGMPYGVLFTLGVAYHLVHDTFFLGWGIKWLWPFSQKSLSLFHDMNGKITREILYWDPKDDAVIRAKYQTPDWIRIFYFRPGFISLTEYPVLIVALILLYHRF